MSSKNLKGCAIMETQPLKMTNLAKIKFYWGYLQDKASI